MLNKLEREVIDISYENGTSHIGSCLTAVGVIDKIYQVKKPEEPFILSCGHAFLALAVVLAKEEGRDARELVKKHGTHPDRDLENGIYCSTGSLGQGLPIAVGMALADRTRNVYCVTSDGELAEGSCWEALRVAGDQRLENLKVAVIANGYGGYSRIDTDVLEMRLNTFFPTVVFKMDLFKYPDWMQGNKAHYMTLTKEQYEEVIK